MAASEKIIAKYGDSVLNKFRNMKLVHLFFSITLFVASFAASALITSSGSTLRQMIFYVMIFIMPTYAYILYSTCKEAGIASFIFVFFLLSFFFYYGQHLITIIDYNYIKMQEFSIIDGRISNVNIVEASFLIIRCLLLIHAGYILGHKSNWMSELDSTFEQDGISLKEDTDKSFTYVAWIFFAISIVPMIIKLQYQFHLTQTLGYLERRSIEDPTGYKNLGIAGVYLSEWFLPSLYMLLITYSEKSKRILVYFFLAAFVGMYLLTGSRFMLLKIAIVVFLIQFIWVKKLNKKKILPIIIFGFFAVIILKAITTFRSTVSGDLSDFISNIGDTVRENVISASLWETGITFTSVSNMIQNCPFNIPFFMGKSYLGAILVVLPEPLRFGYFDNYSMSVSSTFSPLYYNSNLFGYGSSFIAEGYYNFGNFFLLFMPLLGYGVSKLEGSYVKAKIENNAEWFVIVIYFLGELLYGLRTDLYSIPRAVIFYVCVPVMVVKTIRIIMGRKAKNKYL